MEPSRPPPCQQKRRLSKVSSRWRTCVTNLVSLVVWVYGICGSRGEGIVKHHETMNINSRVQSKASILRLDAHDQENVKYHFQWEICSILNHPDPPLKCSDGCWVGTTRLRKTLAKHLFHQKKWESFRNTFLEMYCWKQSPSSVASRCCSTTHPKNNCRESQCRHSFSFHNANGRPG